MRLKQERDPSRSYFDSKMFWVCSCPTYCPPYNRLRSSILKAFLDSERRGCIRKRVIFLENVWESMGLYVAP